MSGGARSFKSVPALTPREAILFEFIKAHLSDHGVAPSFEQMAAHLGIVSKSRIHFAMCSLERKGLVRRMIGRARALELVETDYHHAPDCICDPCAMRRYRDSLKLIEAVKHDAPRHLKISRNSNIKPLSAENRARLLGQMNVPERNARIVGAE